MGTIAKDYIRFPFHEDKACDAARRIIGTFGVDGQMKYLKLIKLLYLIDRKAITETGAPIFGGRYSSLDYGPIISDVYDLIKGRGKLDGPWCDAIKKSGYFVTAQAAATPETLSEAETRIVDTVLLEHGDRTEWELVAMCHDLLPEWTDPNGSSIPIHIEAILKAEGWAQDRIDEMRDDAREAIMLDELFGNGTAHQTDQQPLVVESDEGEVGFG